MNSIVQKYRDAYAKYSERRGTQDVAMFESKRKALRCPSWADCVEEIAVHLARLHNKEWKVYGPFGLRHECTIYLGDKADFDIRKDACASLTVTCQFDEQGLVVYYDSGRILREYPQYSIGARNNLGNEILPLPDDWEEIYQLFVYHPAAKE